MVFVCVCTARYRLDIIIIVCTRANERRNFNCAHHSHNPEREKMCKTETTYSALLLFPLCMYAMVDCQLSIPVIRISCTHRRIQHTFICTFLVKGFKTHAHTHYNTPTLSLTHNGVEAAVGVDGTSQPNCEFFFIFISITIWSSNGWLPFRKMLSTCNYLI